MKIQFHDYQTKSNLNNRLAFKEFILSIFKKENKKIQEVDFIFCTDKFLLSLNKSFLDHNYYTDTLTFLFSNKPITGESYISVERIKENARTLKIPYQQELKRIIIHSTLHFCGYDDRVLKEEIKMKKKQETYLSEWMVSRETK